MLTNVAPADELADIRLQIRELKARETQLREGFLSGELPDAGARFAVEVKSQVRRSFLRDRLPENILNDPRFWRENPTRVVVVKDRLPEPVDEDFDVFEPFE